MIVFVASHLSGNGGTETVLTKVLNNISNSFSTKLLVLGKSSNDRWLDKLNNHVNVETLQCDNKFRLVKSYIQAGKEINNNDIVISLSPSFIRFMNLFRKLTFIKCKIISWIHFSLKDQSMFNPKNITYADYHLAISSKIKEQLLSLGVDRNKISLIYNPIEKQDKLFPYFNTKQTNIAYIGRITYEGQKNLHELLLSLQHVDNIHLFIIGVGKDSEIQKCKNLISTLSIENKITWSGWQNDPWSYLEGKNITATILTSRFEGLPMVFLESISRGIPVISSQFEGYNDVVRENVNGLSYPLGDVHRLTNCLIRVKFLNNREKISNSIYKFYYDNYFPYLDKVLNELSNC